MPVRGWEALSFVLLLTQGSSLADLPVRSLGCAPGGDVRVSGTCPAVQGCV